MSLKNLLILLVFIFSLTTFSCEFIIHRMPSPLPTSKINSQRNEINKEIESGKLQFIVIGDWGEKGIFYQKQVAFAMNKIIREEKVDFILTAGDNFYPAGVNDINDSHFKESFEDIYPFAQLIPWYITLGNHDYMGDIQTLINYSDKNLFWIFPSPYYYFEKNYSGKKRALFIVTDTNEFIDFFGFYYRSYMKGESRINQLNWMNTNLKNNFFQWKIVIGHHPIYSAGQHGDTKALQGKFLDNLENNNVDIYFSGHEHDLQYLKNPNIKTHFFISGAGSKLREIKSNPYSIFFASEPGFAITTLEEKEATIRFINQDAKEIYRTVIKK